MSCTFGILTRTQVEYISFYILHFRPTERCIKGIILRYNEFVITLTILTASADMN